MVKIDTQCLDLYYAVLQYCDAKLISVFMGVDGGSCVSMGVYGGLWEFMDIYKYSSVYGYLRDFVYVYRVYGSMGKI